MALSGIGTVSRVWRLACCIGGTSLALGVGLGGCGPQHPVPVNPTWADVEPILRGTCTGCHGASAAVAGLSYRFDFYDMGSCGDAAGALGGQTLARGLATLIGADVTPPGSGWRSRMPPAPMQPLPDWERETVQRWAASPARGEPRHGDRRPTIQLSAASATADKSLTLSAVVGDPDGESVVGVLKIGDRTMAMDRPGTFSATIDTSTWAEGTFPVSATLCDGWDSITLDLGNMRVAHAAPAVSPPADAAIPDAAGADAGAPEGPIVPDGGSSDGSTAEHPASDAAVATTDGPSSG